MNKPYSIDWHGRSNTYYIYFKSIPTENVRTALKKFGLKWNPGEKAWTIKDSYSNDEGYLLSQLENLLSPFYPVKNHSQDRIRIAKVKAAAKLKLLLLLSISEPQPQPEQITKVQVQDMPVNSIYTDEKRFQNRANAFSSESANRIIKAVENNTFDWSKFDPIIIWFDDKENKYFVLSGHSRLAAFKELSKTNHEFKNIPVKIFSGSQMQAIDLALNSNTLSTKETEVERAMYYNRKRQTCEISRSIGLLGAITECEKLVESDCRDNEGKNANYILNLSYLNPDGFLIESLNKLGVEKDNDSTNVLRTIANWIGEARRNNKELLNVHETEIAKYLLNGGYGNKAGQFKNKTQFNERLKYSFDKWKTAGADPSRPLNLANTLSKSSFEQDFDSRLAKGKADLDQAINEHQEKHTKYLFARMSGQITEQRFNELMAPLIQNVDWHKKEYDRIRGQKDDVKKAASAQTSLFGTFDPTYNQFKNKPKEAIKHLLKVKKGQCTNALYRDDIGYIDIVWGENDKNNKGFGLKHIIEKHGKEIKELGYNVEDFIPIMVQYGNLKSSKEKDKVLLESQMFRVVIKTKWEGVIKKFILTAFDLRNH